MLRVETQVHSRGRAIVYWNACTLSLSLSVLCYPLHACHQQHLLSCARIEVTLIYFGVHNLNVFNSIYYRWSSLSQLFLFVCFFFFLDITDVML